MYHPSTAVVSAVVSSTAYAPPAIPSAGIGPIPKIRHGESGTSSSTPPADRHGRNEHVARPANDARERVRKPDEHRAAENDLRVYEGVVQRRAASAERGIERRSEGEDECREDQTQRHVDDECMEHERIGRFATARAECTRDGRRDAAGRSRRRRASASS